MGKKEITPLKKDSFHVVLRRLFAIGPPSRKQFLNLILVCDAISFGLGNPNRN